MIQAHELMINNWVYHKSFPNELYKVRSVSADRIHPIELIEHCTDNTIYAVQCELDDLLPIPLTPEILFACGFTTDENKVEYGIGLPIGEGADLFIEDEEHPSMSCGIKSFPKNFNYFKDIKYLHQLQNLYHALTQSEIKYIRDEPHG